MLLRELHGSFSTVSGLELDSMLQGLCTFAARINRPDEGDSQARFARSLCDALFTRSRRPQDDFSLLHLVERLLQETVALAGAAGAAGVFNKAMETALYITANLMVVAKFACSSHVPAIRATCLAVAKSTKSAAPAQGCLAPLTAMLREQLATEAGFAPRDVVKVLVERRGAVGSPFHVPGSAQAAALALCGQTVATFPHCFATGEVWEQVFDPAMATLETAWRAGKAPLREWSDALAASEGVDTSQPGAVAVGLSAGPAADAASGSGAGAGASLRVGVTSEGAYAASKLSASNAAGCLEAISWALSGHPSLLALDDAKPHGIRKGSHSLFFFARNAVRYAASSVGGRISSVLAEAGLRIFARHAHLTQLQRYMLATPYSTFAMLHTTVHLAGRRRIRAVAPDAMLAFLRALAGGLGDRIKAERMTGAGASSGTAAGATGAVAAAAVPAGYSAPSVARIGENLHPAKFALDDHASAAAYPPGTAAAAAAARLLAPSAVLNWVIRDAVEAMLTASDAH